MFSGHQRLAALLRARCALRVLRVQGNVLREEEVGMLKDAGNGKVAIDPDHASTLPAKSGVGRDQSGSASASKEWVHIWGPFGASSIRMPSEDCCSG